MNEGIDSLLIDRTCGCSPQEPYERVTYIERMTEIVSTDDVFGGEPRLDSHRISVIQIVDMVRGDRSPEYVADQLGISLGEVHTALAYYYEHPEEMRAVRERHRDLESELRERSIGPSTIEQ